MPASRRGDRSTPRWHRAPWHLCVPAPRSARGGRGRDSPARRPQRGGRASRGLTLARAPKDQGCCTGSSALIGGGVRPQGLQAQSVGGSNRWISRFCGFKSLDPHPLSGLRMGPIWIGFMDWFDEPNQRSEPRPSLCKIHARAPASQQCQLLKR